MTANATNARVDVFIKKAQKWKEEYELLRQIVLDCGLSEDYKWMHPCYTLGEANIALIHGFKDYCALLFPQGALLKDPQGILVQQTENVQAARQLRFTSAQQIEEMKEIVTAYVLEAVQNEKAGLKVKLKETEAFPMPEELEARFAEMPELKTAFDALTPGRRRAYLLHFSQPKQAKTRVSRIEKWTQPILEGKGLND
ncbi:DUF1801 domain-containing protein [Paenibacillus pasadenensis]|uniref:DUF1801 domain-containing protein n=1 Tax=Paenibacillus pasadenensis TaxID=217090 RepID=A0A2N5NDN3_9BACL|nr:MULTISPECIES: YdeI/OmpD-associated family protein [Paenibacillus]PLT48466.1 DUF1801 domain-containing protein [Paenibacillus pasadenensis]QGG58053.1 hypothetical protein GE073_22425 [Paenibacillus sp. B01]